MEDIVLLEWTYSPADYFEVAITISRADYEMTIEGGKVTARIGPDIYANSPDMRNRLHRSLDNRFRGVQLLTHKCYKLTQSSVCRIYPDGHRHVEVFLESLLLAVSIGTPDMVVMDADGNVVSDTKAERLSHINEFSDLVERHAPRDPIVSVLLDSYSASVNDPTNELIHLYEIRDALTERFGNGRTAIATLAVPRVRWSRLGQIANDEPIMQGRHRGKNSGSLRDASEKELQEARDIALELIEGYLAYLETQTSANA